MFHRSGNQVQYQYQAKFPPEFQKHRKELYLDAISQLSIFIYEGIFHPTSNFGIEIKYHENVTNRESQLTHLIKELVWDPHQLKLDRVNLGTLRIPEINGIFELIKNQDKFSDTKVCQIVEIIEEIYRNMDINAHTSHKQLFKKIDPRVQEIIQ